MTTSMEETLKRFRRLTELENSGKIADSMAVRRAIMARVRAGEITLEQAQREIHGIASGAKSKGLLTRSQVLNGD